MNRTIAIAISSALLALSQVTAAPAATPLTTVRVAPKPMSAPQTSRAPGDFDRAFIVQRAAEALSGRLQPAERPSTPPLNRSTTGDAGHSCDPDQRAQGIENATWESACTSM